MSDMVFNITAPFFKSLQISLLPLRLLWWLNVGHRGNKRNKEYCKKEKHSVPDNFC